jgi:hypothetical protein
MTAETRKLAEELRKAHDAMLAAISAEDTTETDQAEQKAWDAYATACNKVNECLDLDCEKKVFDYSYCPDHKE